jgi:hypothetical protein
LTPPFEFLILHFGHENEMKQKGNGVKIKGNGCIKKKIKT